MSTELIWQTVSTSSEDTEKLGQLLGELLHPPAVVELHSDLGGGKTTFVRGLARGLGSKDTVSSPTFTLSKIYKAKNNIEIHHFDFYRLNEPELVAEQLVESLNDAKVVTVVEWSDIVKKALPESRISIEFKPVELSSEEREIVVSYPQTLASVIQKLETQWQGIKP